MYYPKEHAKKILREIKASLLLTIDKEWIVVISFDMIYEDFKKMPES